MALKLADVIGKTVFDIILDASQPAPANPPKIISAEEGSKLKSTGTGKTGVFYRGDSRPPSEIFASGFQPQSGNTNLQHHLEFKGDSAFVSLSRSPESAQNYASGRSANNSQKGYIHVIAPKDVPEGHWIPGIYSPDKNPEVKRNQEFAVKGSVPGSSVSHAYEVTRDNPSARSSKIRNEGYSLRSAGRCVLQRKRAVVCDPAGWAEEPKKTPPKQTGPGEDDGKGKGKGEGEGKSGITGQKTTERQVPAFPHRAGPRIYSPPCRGHPVWRNHRLRYSTSFQARALGNHGKALDRL
ncbi:hypothetical protein MAC_00555 [Metarhizium acridum CQMa 102]|uniref:Pierisin-like domain-containing protein n=1 Tax=Metarhizium acridum (strain CQMa 102) TaxID=655827 RepID=E9DSF7_METAQ|nr:uncharacterized protein MAC_00555 [Metarhizium acridum CQMa 102]EFY93317.1 hypothetical protein MAC_00555 [Metarhizium acridum CQMa 102]